VSLSSDNLTDIRIIWKHVQNVSFGDIYYDLVIELNEQSESITTRDNFYFHRMSYQMPLYSWIKSQSAPIPIGAHPGKLL